MLLRWYIGRMVNETEDYNNWNEQKKKYAHTKRIYFHKGDVWYVALGKNIGYEEDGKNQNFERPILITRKFNNDIFICVPLTSQNKEGKYYHTLISFPGSTAILSQVRLLDAKRLLRYIGKVEHEELQEIKLKIGKVV